MNERREYKVAIAQTHDDDDRWNGSLERNAERLLNEWGVEGFRLIRAEADAQGVMWFVAERVVREEAS